MKINPLYAYEAVQDQAKTSFKNSKPNVLMLNDFFAKLDYEALLKTVKSLKAEEAYEPSSFKFGKLFDKALVDVFSSEEFLSIVRNVTGVKVRKFDLSIKKFGAGNYTLLQDDGLSKKRLVFFYTIGGKWEGDWGGQTIFTFGDERQPIVFEPQGNSLCVMLVPDGMRDFLKYIKHFAGKNDLVKVEGIFL